ncbi:MAG TPA: hypothetical protein VLZ50_01955 [Terracidiphilus sp.]|nr:hypothetical protein [Terracidiphilus sp.]
MRLFFPAFAIVAFSLAGRSQQSAVFRADFSNPEVVPSHWTLTLHPDGSGHFHSERGDSPPQDPPTFEAPNVDRDVQVSESFADRVFHQVRDDAIRHGVCESHMKVAFQGWKTVSYSGPEGHWSCQFNFSRNKDVQALGDSLMAAAGTIVEGARLETLLQHDRLGLDKEMEYVSDAAGDGRLTQICTIRGILERLADDSAVLDRVRKRARTLLAKSTE